MCFKPYGKIRNWYYLQERKSLPTALPKPEANDSRMLPIDSNDDFEQLHHRNAYKNQEKEKGLRFKANVAVRNKETWSCVVWANTHETSLHHGEREKKIQTKRRKKRRSWGLLWDGKNLTSRQWLRKSKVCLTPVLMLRLRPHRGFLFCCVETKEEALLKRTAVNVGTLRWWKREPVSTWEVSCFTYFVFPTHSNHTYGQGIKVLHILVWKHFRVTILHMGYIIL